VLAGAAGALLSKPALLRAAPPLPRPTGDVILTVTGKIGNLNAPGAAEFDRAMLEAIGFTSLSTSSAWTSGPSVYEGVLGRTLMAVVDARGETIDAIAVNDYRVSIPMSDLQSYDVVFALRMDGKQLLLRDKGPIWVVYPRDQHTELQQPLIDKKWIWQLTRLIVA
jgi:hypothetical protein